jgi:ribosomal-protein-alanine N-acetyltransferase
MLIPIILLETDRLELRPTAEEDLAIMHEMRTDLDNQRFIDRPIPMNLDATRLHLEMLMNGNADMRWYNWSIYAKKEKAMVGSIGLWRFSEDRRQSELGYELLRRMQNTGIMTEAMAPVLGFGFRELDLEIIAAETHWENLASIRLLEKYGFKLDTAQNSEEGENYRRFYLDRRDYEDAF